MERERDGVERQSIRSEEPPAQREVRPLREWAVEGIGPGIEPGGAAQEPKVVVGEGETKTAVSAVATSDVASKLPVNDLVNEVMKPFDGKGGGRPDMAQGGAPVQGKYKQISKKLEEVIKKKIG